jgi:hypothetical protein
VDTNGLVRSRSLGRHAAYGFAIFFSPIPNRLECADGSGLFHTKVAKNTTPLRMLTPVAAVYNRRTIWWQGHRGAMSGTVQEMSAHFSYIRDFTSPTGKCLVRHYPYFRGMEATEYAKVDSLAHPSP